jgi:hypothetical protein
MSNTTYKRKKKQQPIETKEEIKTPPYKEELRLIHGQYVRVKVYEAQQPPPSPTVRCTPTSDNFLTLNSTMGLGEI